MISSDPNFEVLKLLTRMQWMLNFEAVASVPNDEDSLERRARQRSLAS